MASEILKFESVDNDRPLVYYKLTLWAFRSGELMSPKDADGKIGKQCRPWSDCSLGAVWSGSTRFAQVCLSENLGSLQYKSF